MQLNGDSNTSQAFWIAFGNFVAICLTIGSTMVLTRFMDKFNYGTYRQIFFVYSTLLSVFTLGLPKAYGYFLPKMPMEEGKALVRKITLIFALLGSMFSLLLFLGAPLFSRLLNNPELNNALRLFSPVPVFLMPTLGIESIFASYKDTKKAAMYSIVTRILLFFCVTIPAVFISASYKGVVLGFVLSSMLSCFFALFMMRLPFRNVQSRDTSVSLLEIITFCVPLMGAGLFNILINSTDQFFISRFFGAESFAEFSNGAMELPFVGMIVGACSTVLLPYYTRLKHGDVDGTCKNVIVSVWNSVFSKTVMLIYPLIIFCMIYSDEIMVILYGSSYLVSGKYFFVMLFNNFMSVVSFYPLLLALNRTKEYAQIYLLDFILLVALEFAAVKLFDSILIICVVSVFCLWFRIFLFIWIIARDLGSRLSSMFPLRIILIVSLFSVILAVGLHSAIPIENDIVSICISGPVYLILVFLVAKVFKIDYLSIVKPLIKKS